MELLTKLARSLKSLLLHCSHTHTEAGLVARSSIFMQRALLDCLIERRHRLAVGLLGGWFVALLDGLAQGPQRGAQARSIGAIGSCALRGLTGALKRRKMISHVWLVPFVFTARYSARTEYAILRD